MYTSLDPSRVLFPPLLPLNINWLGVAWSWLLLVVLVLHLLNTVGWDLVLNTPFFPVLFHVIFVSVCPFRFGFAFRPSQFNGVFSPFLKILWACVGFFLLSLCWDPSGCFWFSALVVSCMCILGALDQYSPTPSLEVLLCVGMSTWNEGKKENWIWRNSLYSF